MKKALIVLALLATGMCARAQVDTLFLGQRNPVYYYWDTNWWDHYALHHPDGIHLNWGQSSFTELYCKPEYARYCYTDSSLRVIGIAVSYYYIFNNHYHTPESELISEMDPEYLRLYEVDSLGDEMHLIAEAQWRSSMSPSHYMVIGREYNWTTSYDFGPIHEVYFDSVVTVYDSFYVATTSNNKRMPSREEARRGYVSNNVNAVIGLSTNGLGYSTADCIPKPNHFRRKLHLLSGGNYDHAYSVTDTNWHTFATRWYHPDDTGKRAVFNRFIYLFPIIDTSRVIPPPACYTPGGLTKVYAEAGVATLMWNGSPHTDHWQLSLCADGCEPEEGNITEWDVTVATLNSLDTGRWYTARVRSVCVHNDSAYYSDWSDSLRFYMPGGNGGGTDPTGIETVADRYTYLMPNPAGETVTVASSFRIGEVELYDLNGKLLARQKVDGLQTALDISALAAGTYIVRVTTNNGTAYKKLIKN